ncbi:putative had superfamily (subfamily iiia) phosphatase [Phaeomoniella chlamydospora]|uniref:Putative had superfamily (Subfamily iiia) phosphatase n=1 Tax=Phaeomoniella chlamydospora TaxID=158046 RepID=A0A0G2E8J5_PHACM|nr:putative had superfamily (subfamily iiia) phosphatase [Phaeomoniella chlamydospora]
MLPSVSRSLLKAALENALITKPALLKPHLSFPTFLDVPLQVGPLLRKDNPPTIRGLVLDNDNTLSPSRDPYYHPAYLKAIEAFKQAEPFSTNPNSMLIVSNRAGAKPEYDGEVEILEKELSLPVLHHKGEKEIKPVIAPMVLEHFSKNNVTSDPQEIAVVGDRLFTDVLMARLMGSWSIYISDGWKDPENPKTKRGSVGWGEWFYTWAERYRYGSLNEKVSPVEPGVGSLLEFLETKKE